MSGREGAEVVTDVLDERRQLINVAYRLLGSLVDAEDAVQETYARWYALPAAEREAVDRPGAWLTTVASRICLDQLRSARVRRERYVGEWLPEPLPDPGDDTDPTDPADRITLDESVSMAFLVVLESMTPAERVAFVLHDVFGYPFADIAEIVGRTPAACRQLASSARARVPSPPTAPPAKRAALVRDFKQAWEAKDIGALVGLLDPDAVTVGDGGGLVTAELLPVEGREQVAQYYADLAGRRAGATIVERMVNGQPGLVVLEGDVIATVLAFDVTEGGIRNIWAVRNPEKLRPWTG
jgi:RNA polymerase sigma-70 factor (ECF subfamily)